MRFLTRRAQIAGLLMFVFSAATLLAEAQPKRVPTVAMLDFRVVPSSGSPAILGRAAADAVVLELTRSGRFDSTPRAQVDQQIKDSDMTLPLGRNDIQRLGQALSADYMAYGEVTEISFTQKPRRAHVTLSVSLTDTTTGELGNGAVETGVSQSKEGTADDETLIQQAITDAAFNVARTIRNYAPIEATVLLARGSQEVTLNRGSHDGIRDGQEMIVLRRGSYVGRIRINSVDDTNSRGAILDGGARPEDHARSVFKLPNKPRRR